jgi:hypothetical protein
VTLPPGFEAHSGAFSVRLIARGVQGSAQSLRLVFDPRGGAGLDAPGGTVAASNQRLFNRNSPAGDRSGCALFRAVSFHEGGRPADTDRRALAIGTTGSLGDFPLRAFLSTELLRGIAVAVAGVTALQDGRLEVICFWDRFRRDYARGASGFLVFVTFGTNGELRLSSGVTSPGDHQAPRIRDVERESRIAYRMNKNVWRGRQGSVIIKLSTRNE